MRVDKYSRPRRYEGVTYEKQYGHLLTIANNPIREFKVRKFSFFIMSAIAHRMRPAGFPESGPNQAELNIQVPSSQRHVVLTIDLAYPAAFDFSMFSDLNIPVQARFGALLALVWWKAQLPCRKAQLLCVWLRHI